MTEGTLGKRAYWRLAPRIHRLRRYASPDYVNPPHDPFEIEYVDPDRVRRFTGRECPHYKNKWEAFGAVRDGDWDVRDDIPGAVEYEGNDVVFYLADGDGPAAIEKRFEATMFHRSMEAHFLDGVPWEETRVVREAIERLESPDRETIWHYSRTPSEILDRCREIDALYRSIERWGCRPMRELNAEAGYDLPFSSAVAEEVLVDVGRDGELLFVDGRHRLSIAKILDLDEIPVATLVRHSQYVR